MTAYKNRCQFRHHIFIKFPRTERYLCFIDSFYIILLSKPKDHSSFSSPNKQGYMRPKDKKSDVINEQHAIYDIEEVVNMRGKVGQAKFG